MLHSRQAAPQIDRDTQLDPSPTIRSKSTLNFGQVISKMEHAYQYSGSKPNYSNSISRVQSALKKKGD